MKLNRDYLAIEYYNNPKFQRYASEKILVQTFEHFGRVSSVTRSHPMFKKVLDSFCISAHDYENHKFFYISKSVLEHSQLIDFDFGKMNIKWFLNLKSQKSTYIVNKDEFYLFKLEENISLRFWHIKRNQSGTLDCSELCVDLVMFDILKRKIPSVNSVINGNKNKEINEKFFKLFLFINLSEPVIEVIKDRQKKEYNYFNKIKNETGVNVHLISTLWNKIIIHDSEFKVRGHFRIQPCGKGRTQYKIIWIDSFVKSGYIRGLEKLKEKDRKISVN